MASVTKIIHVADAVHGAIQITRFEKMLLSSSTFNRLHDVLQNSTVYLTYPSNRTSRFAHSLGTAHLAGKILLSGFLNSPSKVKGFNHKYASELQPTMFGESFKKQARKDIHPDHQSDAASRWHQCLTLEPLYQMASVKGMKHGRFCVLWQAVRCAGLLHDLGHPPFSHVTEGAIEKVRAQVERKDEDKRNTREREFLNAISSACGAEGAKEKLHELLTVNLSERLIDTTIHALRDSSKTQEEWRYFYFCLQVAEVTKALLSKDPGFLLGLTKIVSGPLDADRIDYILRDTMASGCARFEPPLERLILSARLVSSDEGYCVAFDTRSVSIIEQLLGQRWHLYKYVIYHHRVVKTDALLRDVVVTLSNEWLASEESASQATNPAETAKLKKNRALPNNISGLWMGIRDVFADTEYFQAIEQWNDSWLTSVLRSQYHSQGKSLSDEARPKLEELLSNTRNYQSLVKRYTDFQEINHAAHKACNFHVSLLENLVGQMGWVSDEFKHKDGNFLLAVRVLCFGLYNNHQYFEESVSSCVKEVCPDGSFVEFKKPKKLDNFCLQDMGTLVSLEQVSVLPACLEDESRRFPPFFVYVRLLENAAPDDLSETRSDLGSALGSLFAKFLEDARKNLEEESKNE